MTPKNPVIAIGLDSAEPKVIEKWMAEGKLPNLSRLCEQGTQARLENFDAFSAETPWTTFLTGVSPKTLGYWSPLKFREGTYKTETLAAYAFEEYPLFYSLGKEYRVAVFDVPQARLSEQVNGPQVLAWGAHSPQGPSVSQPAELFQQVVDQYGPHPGLHNDYAECLNLEKTLWVRDLLLTGVKRRIDACRDLVKQEAWDLFLTVFGEAHGAGHNLWQLSQPEHPLYETLHQKVEKDPMLEVFQEIDRGIGEIMANAPENATVVVFSAHGMGPNTMDLPSILFLPEFLYRLNFPGKTMLANGKPGEPLGPPRSYQKRNSWIWDVWTTKTDPNPLRRFLRANLGQRAFKLVQPFLGPAQADDLISPFELMGKVREVPWQPTGWYTPLWPKMKAFALQSFSEGYVRINLKGREPQGIVDPSEYDSLCEEITEKLKALKDARTGTPMARKIIKTRQSADDRNPRLPDADLVVVWQDDYATDVVESPDIGRIGPVPHFRSGSHRPEGFLIASGPGIAPGHQLPKGHALDLAPTILSLMGAPLKPHFEGKPLLHRELDNSATNSPALVS